MAEEGSKSDVMIRVSTQKYNLIPFLEFYLILTIED